MFGRKIDLERKPRSQSGAGGGGWIRRMPKDVDELEIRFLTDPTEWRDFLRCWDTSVRRSFVVPEEFVAGDHQQVTRRVAAHVLDIDADRATLFELPVSVLEDVRVRWSHFSTMTDRDYILVRVRGDMPKDTRYKLVDGTQSVRDLSRGDELPDIETVLAAEWQRAVDEGWVDAIPEVEPPVKKADEPEPEPERAPALSSNGVDVQSLTLGKLRAMARDMGIDPSGMDRSALAEAIESKSL